MAGVIAVVLAGGASRRMGDDKRTLRLFPASPTFLDRAVGIGRVVADRVVVVGGPDGEPGVEGVADRWPGEGPLGALVTAMAAFPGDRLIALACDYPMLQADLVARIVAGLDGHEAAVAVETDGGRQHPLVAAYDVERCGGTARALFDRGERSMGALVGRLSVRQVGTREGADEEAHALSLTNVNTPGGLAEIRRRSLALDQRAT